MSNFQVAPRPKQESVTVLLVRVIVAFALFAAGLVLIGVGSTGEAASSPFVFVGGILAIGLAFGLPMVGAHER
ncbi:hypothetical protein L1785_05875 [Antribacter sp. KLBMP9083]|uniref:Uncharacterized protein n=1 Tax=Antribacter soli TaxID=2910976 RepID=A0AA41QBQ4_9MICO|nr:hypothetical protein [Antribacter soli]MCF4120499.1 hypothetical protein [Antribacter soli]